MTLSAFTPPPAKQSQKTCRVGWVLSTIDSEDADMLRTWIADPTVPLAWIERTVDEALSVQVPSPALTRHRRAVLKKPGGCQCVTKGTA